MSRPHKDLVCETSSLLSVSLFWILRADSDSTSQEQASRWLRVPSGFPKGTTPWRTSTGPRYCASMPMILESPLIPKPNPSWAWNLFQILTVNFSNPDSLTVPVLTSLHTSSLNTHLLFIQTLIVSPLNPLLFWTLKCTARKHYWAAAVRRPPFLVFVIEIGQRRRLWQGLKRFGMKSSPHREESGKKKSAVESQEPCGLDRWADGSLLFVWSKVIS